MTRPLVLVGGGGHAKVVFDAAASSGWTVGGFLDDHADAPLQHLGVKRLGLIREWSECSEQIQFIPAIGDNDARRGLMLNILQSGEPDRVATVVHSSARISPHDVIIGTGTFIGPGAVINPGVRIGMGVIINSGAIVEHDVVIGDWAHIAPGAALGGAVVVEEGALAGLGCRILPGRCVGAGTVVGAGAVVTKDVPPQTTVRGNPAREQ